MNDDVKWLLDWREYLRMAIELPSIRECGEHPIRSLLRARRGYFRASRRLYEARKSNIWNRFSLMILEQQVGAALTRLNRTQERVVQHYMGS